MPVYPQSRVASAYKSTSVKTASKAQVIVMLHDTAIRSLAQGAQAMRERRVEVAHNRLRSAERIIAHLRSSLNVENEAEVIGNLAELYTFFIRHLSKARISREPEMVEDVSRLMATLRGSFAQID
jgi:flagellar secretion chaperone FliS